MKSSVLLQEMTSVDYQEKINQGNKVVIIPVGAIEQHGPHMCMNVDVLLPSKIGELVADNIDAIVAPPVVYGYKSQQRSGGGNHLCGTTSLDGQTLISIAKDIIKEYCRHGLRKFVIMNGHYENNMFLVEGIDLALRELRYDNIDNVEVMALSYWDFVDDEAITKLYPDGFTGWDVEHGGVMETSLMMKLFPEHVDIERVQDLPPADLPPYDVFPVRPEITPASGCLSSAKESSVEKGEILLEVCVNGISNAIIKTFC